MFQLFVLQSILQGKVVETRLWREKVIGGGAVEHSLGMLNECGLIRYNIRSVIVDQEHSF